MLANNPLKQFFRRPSIYLKLPSGGEGYSTEVLSMTETGEVPVYPMTAIDEITVRTPDALYNGTAIVELIKSCVPAIKDPWQVKSIDVDAILLAIKSCSQGNDLEVESTCPACTEAATYGVNLIGMLQNIKKVDYSTPLRLGEMEIKFRPLIYKEMSVAGKHQFELQKVFSNMQALPEEERPAKMHEAVVSVTAITMDLLSQTIEYIKIKDMVVTQTEFILEFLQNCDKNIYVEIRDYHGKLKDQSKLEPQKIKCIHCQHEYSQDIVINQSDFFG
jgi:hypothetical protein